MCEIQEDRLCKFFSLNYDSELEHDEQKKLNILRDPGDDIHKDVLYILSQNAKYNFFNRRHSSKKTTKSQQNSKSVTPSRSRGVVRRKANPLESDKIIHQKTPRSVHFHEKEDDDVVTSESGTIIRRLRLKKEDREIPQFQALLQDVLQEKEVQSTEVSVSDNWSFQESSYKTNETKYFYDIEANMSDSFDVPQDPKNYIMQSLFLDSPTNYAYEKDVGTKEMKVAETEKKQRNHRIRFWLNNSQDHSPKIQLLSYAGKQSDIYNI